ncbi:MAG: chromate transporter [Clostridia bacterium]|nr:chromate transporter [Clostridia bacterium]
MSLLELFYVFFKIGLFTFGGGYGTIPLIEGEIVNKGYLNAEMFLNFVGVAESTPGPFAVNIATFIGAEYGGILGSLIATVAVVLPAFIIMLIISALLKNFSSNKWVKGFMNGVQPFVIGLIISTGLLIIVKCLYVNFGDFTVLPSFDVTSIIVTAIIIAVNYVFKFFKNKNLPAIPLILVSALLGLMFF